MLQAVALLVLTRLRVLLMAAGVATPLRVILLPVRAVLVEQEMAGATEEAARATRVQAVAVLVAILA
jgi:flagellar biosynthesis regulator FlbT